MDLCTCEDWQSLVGLHDLVAWDPSYGWTLKWIQLTNEKGYTQVHRYGIPIKCCPFCGHELKKLEA